MNGTKLLLVAVVAGTMAASCAQQTTKGGTAKGLQKVYFDFDSADIKAESEPVLKGNAAWIKDHSKTNIVIQGNCDERGTNEYNIALGDRRASSAKKYLINLGVAKGQLSTVSYGEEKPVASCNDESCWSQNRRDEFVQK